MRDQTLLPIILILLTASAHAATVGFRNDGSGHWPDTTPPTAWDDAGTNTAWKVDLGHWGNSEPIVVGDRIYLVKDLNWFDFDRVAPSLLCLDPITGSVIWETELDHTAALPPAQAKQAKADWISLRKKYHEGWQLCEAIAKQHGPGQAADAAAREQLPKIGMDLGKPLTTFNLNVKDQKYRDLEKNLAKSHFWQCQWSQPHGQWCGAGYATPVSDGTHIWVTTGYGAAFCLDLNGKVRWTSLLEGASGKKQGWCVSPVLVDGVVVIADSENCHGWDAVGLDAKTGKEGWRVKAWNSWEGYSIGSSLVLQVAGKPVVHLPSGRVIRPTDGAILAEGLGRQKWTASTGAGDLLIVPFMGVKSKAKLPYPWLPDTDSLVAYRLSWDGADRLEAKRLWSVPVGDRNLEISPVLANGLVFQASGRFGGIIALDAETGKQVGSVDGNALGRLRLSWNLAVAGKYLYAIDFEKGTVAVVTADKNLAKVAVNPAIGRPDKDCPLPYATWRIGAGRGPDPRLPQTGALTFAGKRLYLRAWNHLYCFGGK